MQQKINGSKYMKKISIIITGATAFWLNMAQNIQASGPITGAITFKGSVTLNAASLTTVTEAINWFNMGTTPGSTGSFTSVASGAPVTVAAPWVFNGGSLAAFCEVGAAPLFYFNLISASIPQQTGGTLKVFLSATVSASGYTTTAVSGYFLAANPPVSGTTFNGTIFFGVQPPIPIIHTNGLGSLKIIWPDLGSFTLQQCSNLVASSWTTVTNALSTANGTNSITLTAQPGAWFFRLSNP
jgi:hypothetical protein